MTEPATLGAYLRAARRRRRVGIERAAEETRIRPDFLMRMESDEFDFLAPAYVRGFLKNYARFLNLETEALLEEFDRRHGAGRADSAQMVALDRRRRGAPRERKRMNNWMVAAVLAAVVLFGLTAIGLISDPTPRDDAGRVAGTGEGSSSPSEQPAASPSPTPSPDPSPSQTIAFADGIALRVDASTAECWIDVTADGVAVFSGTLAVGQSERFTAIDSLTIILGYPAGVDLTVNGQDLGSPGDVDPITLRLPDDIDSL